MIKVTREIDIEQFSGGLVSWDSGEVSIVALASALTAIGEDDLMPDPNTFKTMALESATESFAKKVCPSRRGYPIKTVRLDTHHPRFVAQQQMKTKDKADYRDIVVIELDAGGQCHIVRHNNQLLPKLTTHLAQCEAWIQSKYDAKVAKVPSNHVTQVLNKLLKKQGCMPMSRQGRFFAVPSDSTTATLDTFASHIPNASQLDIRVSPIVLPPTASMFEKIASKCTEEMNRMLEEVEEGLQEAGDKQRKNGAQTRYDKCEAVKDYADSFTKVLGDTKTKFFKDAASKIQDAITTNTVLDILS